MTDLSRLREAARERLPELVALRRRIHARPELGLDCPGTGDAVIEALAGLGIAAERAGGRTGAVLATLEGEGGPGETILLRADMDALPMREETGLAYGSEVEGAMHACGHDAHVAMLVGAAGLLAERRRELHGNVRLLFQPGEEGHGGARILVEEGLLEREPRPAATFALHVDPTLPNGMLTTKGGALLAAGDVFSIHLEGRGGHASQPHDTLDPIPVACEIVSAIQALVTRRMHAFDPVVVSVTRIQAGTTHNVIPRDANVLGTIRTVSEKARSKVHAELERLVAGIASAHGLDAKLHLMPGYPVTLNHDGFADFVLETGRELLGAERARPMRVPVMGAEDFSYLLQRLPGAMAFLGARPPDADPHPLHSSRMVLGEDAMAEGAAVHAAVALRWLSGAGPHP